MTRAALGLLLLVVLLLGAAIGFFNAQPVQFNYLVGAAELPLVSPIFGELLMVSLICWLIYLGRVWRLQREIRGLRKRLAASEVELKNLRALPLQSGAPGGSSTAA